MDSSSKCIKYNINPFIERCYYNLVLWCSGHFQERLPIFCFKHEKQGHIYVLHFVLCQIKSMEQQQEFFRSLLRIPTNLKRTKGSDHGLLLPSCKI